MSDFEIILIKVDYLYILNLLKENNIDEYYKVLNFLKEGSVKNERM